MSVSVLKMSFPVESSAKRKFLLNDDSDLGPNQRSSSGWNDDGILVDSHPILQHFTWSDYLNDIFGPSTTEHVNETDVPEVLSEQSNSTNYAQKNMEQWVGERESWPSSSAELARDESALICFGMIYRAPVKLLGEERDILNKLRSNDGCVIPGHCQVALQRDGDRILIKYKDGTIFGELDEQTKKALCMMAEGIEFDVSAPTKPIYEVLGKGAKEVVVRVNIDIYGPRGAANEVGGLLAENKVYLQEPNYLRPGVPYDNPHVLVLLEDMLHGNSGPLELAATESSDEREKLSFEETIEDIFSHLTRDQNLAGINGDANLESQLFLHQQKALEFLMQRENGPISETYSLWKPHTEHDVACWRHVVSGLKSYDAPVEVGGGILADEMGMGKSLSLLALISLTLGQARQWTIDELSTSTPRHRVPATLIVASSDLMINEWINELDMCEDFPEDIAERRTTNHFRHFIKTPSGKSCLNVLKYHGKNRTNLTQDLYTADIVFTTYHTLAADSKLNSFVFNQIEWYRVILDEAHIIRRQSSWFHRSVASLEARSRWCLTGTPVQNRLEDIACLFAFLKIRPIHNLAVFRKFIAVPYDQGGINRRNAIHSFSLLLDALCLRRTTKGEQIFLGRKDTIREIDLSPDERRQYDHTKENMVRAICNQVGDFQAHSALSLFQVTLQLRILCNHGTWQQPFSWAQGRLHRLDVSEAGIEVALNEDSNVACSICSETFHISSYNTLYRRYTEICVHVICRGCLENMPGAEESLPTNCPLCDRFSGQMRSYEQYFRVEGHSSKMHALIKDVLPGVWDTKSIIFSCWTHTLDLIERYLARHIHSKHVRRIDGDCTTKKREHILRDFADNGETRLLIMTTGTGAVGLNLATANRVFLVEPQWNPSIEEQAIARALRIGQKQAVQVTRYITRQTVEQDIRRLQGRKLEIADIAKGS